MLLKKLPVLTLNSRMVGKFRKRLGMNFHAKYEKLSSRFQWRTNRGEGRIQNAHYELISELVS